MEMRRKEKQINDPAELAEILAGAKIMHLAMNDGGEPYVVPLNYGVAGDHVYFHSARAGRKMDILAVNNRVCFTITSGMEIVDAGEDACEWGAHFKSLIGVGRAVILENSEEKEIGLRAIMAQYSDREFRFSENKIRTTAVVRIDIEEMTGKKG